MNNKLNWKIRKTQFPKSYSRYFQVCTHMRAFDETTFSINDS